MRGRLLILATQHESTQPVRYVAAAVLGSYRSRSRRYGVLGTLAYPRLVNYRIRRTMATYQRTIGVLGAPLYRSKLRSGLPRLHA